VIEKQLFGESIQLLPALSNPFTFCAGGFSKIFL